MNRTSAMTIDLVVCYDKELCEHLKRMSAPEYFKSSNQLRTDNPAFLHVLRWEMVPGQILENYPCLPPRKSKVEGVLVFADYATPGSHRVAVDPKVRVMRVVMGPENIQATEGGENAHEPPHVFQGYPASETLTFTSQSNKDLS